MSMNYHIVRTILRKYTCTHIKINTYLSSLCIICVICIWAACFAYTLCAFELNTQWKCIFQIVLYLKLKLLNESLTEAQHKMTGFYVEIPPWTKVESPSDPTMKIFSMNRIGFSQNSSTNGNRFSLIIPP